MSNPESDWNSEDQNILRQWLESRTGAKLITTLAESAPVLFPDGDTNKILIRAGELRGFQAALRELLLLANPPPSVPKEITEYPDLTDDAAWQDGQKIQPPTQS